VRGRPGGRFQFSGGGSKMAWLASAFSSRLKIKKFAAQSRQKKRQIRGDFAVVIIAMQNSQMRVSVAGLKQKTDLGLMRLSTTV